MGPKTPVPEGDLFRQPLREQINLKHPLVRLADLIDWDRLSTAMSASCATRCVGWLVQALRGACCRRTFRHGRRGVSANSTLAVSGLLRSDGSRFAFGAACCVGPASSAQCGGSERAYVALELREWPTRRLRRRQAQTGKHGA
ncbi:Transposase [Mycetohabitans rhizoxinica HKI 454]|uniref:Transposase n=1 Tax=Mycetohabitans rhizoxinica (strain DSM 19002 / CIP 109453 / HKI 454) TaxID=882378 RepID=E5AT31_MYCRK|nr:Transposase [Mycetohabitans rhizoxinica HKI 454]